MASRFVLTAEEHSALTAQVQALTERAQLQLKCTDWLCYEMAVPNVRNCSAQILMFLLAEQSVSPTPECTRSILSGSNFHKLVSAVCPLTTDKFASSFEGLIKCCNKSTHCSNLTELDGMVRRSMLAIRAFKQLKSMCPDEVAIINNYPVFRHIIFQGVAEDTP